MTAIAPSGLLAYLRRAHRGTAFLSASAVVVTPAGWLAEAQRRGPVSRTARVPAILAGLADHRRSVTVTLDPSTVHRVLLHAHLLAPALRRLLHRLITCGLLAAPPAPPASTSSPPRSNCTTAAACRNFANASATTRATGHACGSCAPDMVSCTPTPRCLLTTRS